MPTTRLALYNNALRRLGARKLATLTENREDRRVLDSIWDADAIGFCLEQGLWNFAMRTAKLDYSPSVEPPFGLRRAFNKPDDFVRTAAVCIDQYFDQPLLRYTDEAGFWFADLDVIYVRYVSNDTAYGRDLSLWPVTFTKYVYTYFAMEACERITQSTSKRESIEDEVRKLLTEARSKDAMAEPTAFPPQGTWAASRQGGRWGWGASRGRRG